MSITIQKKMKPRALEKSLSPSFMQMINFSSLPELFTLIQFPYSRNHVVLPKEASKAIKKLKASEEVVVIAGGFSEEARNLLSNISTHIYATDGFYWTEESYKKIKNGL